MTTLEKVTERISEVTWRYRANGFMNSVREVQSAQIENFSMHVERVCTSLGRHVAEVASDTDGFVIEAKRKPTTREIERVDAILEAAQIRNWQRDMLEAPYERRYKAALEALDNTLADYGYPSSGRGYIAERVLAEGGRRVGLLDLKKGTREALFNLLEFARANGLDPLEAAKYIEEFVPAGQFVNAGPGYRAKLIARTEINHAWRFASLETYRRMPGANMVVMYDGDSDAQCSSRNGAIVTIDEAAFEMFVTHPNCVLAFAPAYI